MPGSMYTATFKFKNTQNEALAAAIDVMTKVGRRGPTVDRLLGKVSGPIIKKRVPFRECKAEITVTEKAGVSSVFIAVICERDELANLEYSMNGYRQIVSWLLAPHLGLKLVP